MPAHGGMVADGKAGLSEEQSVFLRQAFSRLQAAAGAAGHREAVLLSRMADLQCRLQPPPDASSVPRVPVPIDLRDELQHAVEELDRVAERETTLRETVERLRNERDDLGQELASLQVVARSAFDPELEAVKVSMAGLRTELHEVCACS
jgi:hypothetical protein